MYICKCSKIVHIIIERNLTSVLNLTEATQKNGKFSWQKAKKKKCIYITNCRQYCFTLLGLISSVLMSLMKVRTSTGCDLAILVRCSTQLSYEATDIGRWSFMGPKEPVRNECWSYMWNISYIELQMWNQVSYDPRSYEFNSCNWVYRSLKKLGLQWSLNPWLAIPVWESNQMIYEATDVGSWK